jgi:hypothetical protein
MQEFLKNNRQKIPSRELITISLTYYLVSNEFFLAFYGKYFLDRIASKA